MTKNVLILTEIIIHIVMIYMIQTEKDKDKRRDLSYMYAASLIAFSISLKQINLFIL